MSTLAIWCHGVQFHDVSPHNFDGLVIYVLQTLNSSNPETATFVWQKASKLNVACFYKKAGLGKMLYSLYSSCCTNDLQGHPRSIIFMSLESQYVTSY